MEDQHTNQALMLRIINEMREDIRNIREKLDLEFESRSQTAVTIASIKSDVDNVKRHIDNIHTRVSKVSSRVNYFNGALAAIIFSIGIFFTVYRIML